jgi:hypothetical protein
MKQTGNEAITVLGRTNHWHFERTSGGHDGQRVVPQAWHFGRDLLHLSQEYGGMEVSEAKRLRALEEENA